MTETTAALDDHDFMKALLNHLWVYPLCQQQGGAGVAQVVKPDVGQASSLQQRPERPAQEVLFLDRAAYLIREYQPQIVPRWPQAYLFL